MVRKIRGSIAAGALAIVGCSSSSSLPPGASPTPPAVCPTTLGQAILASCTTEGLSCYPMYPCNALMAQATCTCQRGRFACVDVTGTAYTGEAGAACPAEPIGVTCPPSEARASGAACSVGGAVCSYPSACDGGTPGFDQCQCTTGTQASGREGLVFECSSPCVPEGAAGDASVGDAAPGDAAADAAGPADAEPADAHGD